MKTFTGPHALKAAQKAAGVRPLRAPHHTASVQSIVGRLYRSAEGVLIYKPGEIGLSQGGVLLLDELPEWRREVIEAIGFTLKRGAVDFYCHGDQPSQLRVPVQFEVIATAHDCPCGMLYSQGPKSCACTPDARERFNKRIRRFQKLLSPEGI